MTNAKKIAEIETYLIASRATLNECSDREDRQSIRDMMDNMRGHQAELARLSPTALYQSQV